MRNMRKYNKVLKRNYAVQRRFFKMMREVSKKDEDEERQAVKDENGQLNRCGHDRH